MKKGTGPYSCTECPYMTWGHTSAKRHDRWGGHNVVDRRSDRNNTAVPPRAE